MMKAEVVAALVNGFDAEIIGDDGGYESRQQQTQSIGCVEVIYIPILARMFYALQSPNG